MWSMLALGHVFAANLFLGFALAGWPEFLPERFAFSMAGFLHGALMGAG